MENSMIGHEIKRAKKNAAVKAIEENIDRDLIIGIGSGTTIVYAVEHLKAIVSEEKYQIICIPTSFQSKQMIIDAQLTLGSLNQFPKLDIAFDGADEVDADLNLIKGGGGCLVQEKIVAKNADKFVVIVDWRKISTRLGDYWRSGLPIEIIPASYQPLINKMKVLGGNAILREGKGKLGPIITDNGNFIIDVDFGEIINPVSLESDLKSLSGVVDSGLFTNMVSQLYIGKKDGTVQKRGA